MWITESLNLCVPPIQWLYFASSLPFNEAVLLGGQLIVSQSVGRRGLSPSGWLWPNWTVLGLNWTGLLWPKPGCSCGFRVLWRTAVFGKPICTAAFLKHYLIHCNMYCVCMQACLYVYQCRNVHIHACRFAVSLHLFTH